MTVIGLVGCVKQKAARAAPAKDLYLSALFRGRRRYVEASCERWYVLSALHGLVRPDDLLQPYDRTLASVSRRERRAWSERVLSQLRAECERLEGVTVEVHAGAAYTAHGLIDGLRREGAKVRLPTSGMAIGEQLAFYKKSAAR